MTEKNGNDGTKEKAGVTSPRDAPLAGARSRT